MSLVVAGWLLASATPVRADECMGNFNCTSKDTRIAAARVKPGSVTQDCSNGNTTAKFILQAEIATNATRRYDFGVWINNDGGPANTGDSCSASVVPPSEASFTDGDVCGDVGKADGDKFFDIGPVEVACEDTDGDHTVDADSCIAWEQQASATDCSGPDTARPGTPSKCHCERINIVGLPIVDKCKDVVCTASDQCHVAGTCDPATGECSNPTAQDGTTCNDGDLCTTNDTCTGGVCGGTAVTCTASDQCHVAGVCDPSTGACTNPTATDGTGCNDNNLCTTNDTCTGGVCGGTGVTCTASDQCHVAGTCNPATGVCSNPTATDGTGCNDSNLCTTNDTCTGGICGGTGVTCTASDQCHVAGTCDPATGGCSNPTAQDGTGCNDGNKCTTSDTCTGGVCGGTAVTCTASDQCHVAGTCSPDTGACSNPNAPNGTPCTDDQNVCTKDQCTDGTCTHDPTQPSDQETDQSARAYGLTLRLGGNDVPLGAPDTLEVGDGSNAAHLAVIDQLEPLINIHLMDETASASGGHSEAISETANVALLNLATPPPFPLPLPPAPLAYLVQASAVESKVVCDATVSGASCSDAGSHIANLKILGIQYGDVTPNNRPQPVNVHIPGVGKVTIAIFEEETSGANAGIPQPQGQVNHADLKLNAIHVSIELGSNEVLDLVVAHAEGSATTGPVCTEAAHVSGRGLVAGATLCTEDGKPCDQFVDDPSNQLVNELKGLVDLPSGGGSQSTSVDVGPIPDAINSPTFTLVKADAGTSQTDGTVSGNDAQSHTLTRTAQADIIDTHDGNPQSTPVIHLGVIQTECNSTTANGGSSTGTTTIADAKIGGQDLCTAMGLDPAPCSLGSACCHPPVNTNLCTDTPLAPLLQPICDGLGLKLLLNEQTGNQTGNPTDITVNGVHVIAKTPLTLNADAKVSSSHCDVKSPATE